MYNGSILWIRFSGWPIAVLVNVFIWGVYASLTFNTYVYYSQLSGRECFWQQSKFFRLNCMECFWHKKSDCLAGAPVSVIECAPSCSKDKNTTTGGVPVLPYYHKFDASYSISYNIHNGAPESPVSLLSLIAESISQLQVWAASIAETHLHVSKWPVIALNAHVFGTNAPCGLAFKLMLAQVFLSGKGNQSIVLGSPAWSLCHCCHMKCIFLVAVKHYLVTITSTNFFGRIDNRVAFV